MRGFLQAAAIAVSCLSARGANAEMAIAPPPFLPGGPVALGAVIDSETLRLADGRTLRLVDIDTPAARDSAALAARAEAAVQKLVATAPLELRYSGNGTDRHGRLLAQLFAGGTWVEGELLRRGLARVHGSADNRIGLDAMLALENEARQARRGLWRSRRFAVRAAADAARYAGSFQIVEGVVSGAAEVDGGVYLNFGPDWHTAFSAHLDRDAVKLCRAAGLDPRKLGGARLRVRGFIDGTRRPVIEIAFPEQIERL